MQIVVYPIPASRVNSYINTGKHVYWQYNNAKDKTTVRSMLVGNVWGIDYGTYNHINWFVAPAHINRIVRIFHPSRAFTLEQ